MEQDSRGNVKEEILQNKLNGETGEGKTEVSDIGEDFEVLFTDSKRYYTVDKNGNIGEYQEIIEDKSPGNITKDEEGNTIEENKPYEIWCIEDLVVLSNMSRGKGNYLENEEIVDISSMNKFLGKEINLMRNLNFNSKYSYADLSLTWSYDEEKNSYIIDKNSTENLKDLLTNRNGIGFVPISESTGSAYLMFQGVFDGKNHEISNLYENNTTGGGLFNTIYSTTIKNLGLTNVDITSSKEAYGITRVAFSSNLYNCYVSGTLKGSGSGGIVGSAWGNIDVVNCCNLATIESSGSAGGIITYRDIGGTTNIVNCYNLGKISGGQYGYVSGIIGNAYNTGIRNIINTCSLGTISKKASNSQNFYYAWGGATVKLEYCYYLDEIINEKVTVNEDSIEFSKNDQTVLNNLNKYVNEHKNDYISEGIELYNWEFDSNGLPKFKK